MVDLLNRTPLTLVSVSRIRSFLFTSPHLFSSTELLSAPHWQQLVRDNISWAKKWYSVVNCLLRLGWNWLVCNGERESYVFWTQQRPHSIWPTESIGSSPQHQSRELKINNMGKSQRKPFQVRLPGSEITSLKQKRERVKVWWREHRVLLSPLSSVFVTDACLPAAFSASPSLLPYFIK